MDDMTGQQARHVIEQAAMAMEHALVSLRALTLTERALVLQVLVARTERLTALLRLERARFHQGPVPEGQA